MPIGIAISALFHVGAMPRWTLSSSTSGEKTSVMPTTTSSSWVARSVMASTMFSPAASRTPITLIADKSATTPMPNRTSPGACSSDEEKRPPR